jgi:hypothetical protein
MATRVQREGEWAGNVWMLTRRRPWPGWSGFCVAPLSSSGRLSMPRVRGRLDKVLGLGIDLAADEARNLLPETITVDGPVPVGNDPAGLLQSAEQLLRRVTTPRVGTGLHGLRAHVADLVWEANTGVGG